MKKILVGVKHREALESIRFMNYFQEKNNWSIEFSLVTFFKLTNKEIEVISREGIKFISVDWEIPFIKGDGKDTKLAKLYKTFLTYNIFKKNLKMEYEGVLISPGGYLLDQLIAFAITNNIPSYVMQNGFIAPIEKKEKTNTSRYYLYGVLAIFSDFFLSRLKLKESTEYPVHLTFGKEYSDYLNSLNKPNRESISVGCPRFFKLDEEKNDRLTPPYRALYLSSSALYENEFELHEMIKLQVNEIAQKIDNETIELHLRPHPRDDFNWEKDSLSEYIKIVDNSDSVLIQIQDYDFVIAERSTAVLQAILLGKIGFWITMDDERKYEYDYICHETVDTMLSDIMNSVTDKDYYLNLHNNQKEIIKILVEATGEEATYKILTSVIGPISVPTGKTNLTEYLDYLKLVKDNPDA